MVAIALPLVVSTLTALAAPCSDEVPVYEHGRVTEAICLAQAGDVGLTVVDLSDHWAPRVLTEDPSLGDVGRQPFLPRWRALAREEESDPRWRDLELYGVSPAPSVAAARLRDVERHRCHARVDDTGLVLLQQDLAPNRASRRQANALAVLEQKLARNGVLSLAEVLRRHHLRTALAPILALQGHLACDGLLTARDVDGGFGPTTSRALALFMKRNAVIHDGALDEPARRWLTTTSQEQDVRTALRALRERVADAAGLVEDGTARGTQRDVVGRLLDEPRPDLGAPLPAGAPDLVGKATDAAARALGIVDAASARRVLDDVLARGGRVALALPAPPPWHGPAMDLRVEIDRGDVAGLRRGGRQARRPTLTLWARVDAAREVALVRWPTTVGGWENEKKKDGMVEPEFMESPTGRFVWREIYAAPVWYPPPSVPDAELAHRVKGGGLGVSLEKFGPGPFSAYGLVMIPHVQPVVKKDGSTVFFDSGVRTHGTASVASVTTGSSHGCHRLWSKNALRAGSFLLAHRPAVRRGPAEVGYSRRIEIGDAHVNLVLAERGTVFELDPPVPVVVLDSTPDAL